MITLRKEINVFTSKNVIINILMISDHDALLFTMYMPTTVEECKNPIQSDKPTSKFNNNSNSTTKKIK